MYKLLESLEGRRTSQGLRLFAGVVPTDDDIQVLRVVVEGRDEFPVYISRDAQQLLCIAYVWRDEEIRPERRAELLEMLVTLNLPMPLSSFSKVGDQYVIFGAMPPEPVIEHLVREIEVLSDNTLTALEALQDYFIA